MAQMSCSVRSATIFVKFHPKYPQCPFAWSLPKASFNSPRDRLFFFGVGAERERQLHASGNGSWTTPLYDHPGPPLCSPNGRLGRWPSLKTFRDHFCQASLTGCGVLYYRELSGDGPFAIVRRASIHRVTGCSSSALVRNATWRGGLDSPWPPAEYD